MWGLLKLKANQPSPNPSPVNVSGKKVLVVDEIADTGKSLQLIREHLKARGASEVRIATIYLKPWSIVKPDYYAKETNRWVVFPWEVKETVRKIVQKYREQGEPLEPKIEKLVKAGLSRRLIERFLRETLEEEPC
jgi:hypoxanthine phosphoribosyltransferase